MPRSAVYRDEGGDFFRELTFRPRATPSPNIPLGARSVGHYRVPGSRQEDSDAKHFLQVFWGVTGKGTLLINNEARELGPQEAAVYLPGMEHHLQADGDTWEYRWWTMDGPLASEIASGFGIKADIYRAGPPPTEQFDELKGALEDLSQAGERRASAIAYSLLCKIRTRRSVKVSDPLVESSLDIIHRHWSDANFGVEVLAQSVRVHRSTLSREFQATLGLSPVQYITRLRVQNAMSLLKESTLPMVEIAARCGYADPNYFSRVIRRHTGQSPLQFRKR